MSDQSRRHAAEAVFTHWQLDPAHAAQCLASPDGLALLPLPLRRR